MKNVFLAEDRVRFHDLHPPMTDLLGEVEKGLNHHPKRLPPKLFYDQRGSDLFSKITRLKEYYLTQSELRIMNKTGNEIASFIGSQAVLIEYGCGASEKIQALLKNLEEPTTYVAIDISREHLLEMTHNLARLYPQLEVIAVCGDFTHWLRLPLNGKHRKLKKTAFFPGSSIGNFEPGDARDFLRLIAEEVEPGGALLIGVDLKKDRDILQAAYNDTQGVTEAFNKNILARLNRVCSADFNLDRFGHRAFYNDQRGRIEMHLESLDEQEVKINGFTVPFRKGETIHTENSYKYHIEEFQELARQAGWNPVKAWTDERNYFSLHYLEAV